MENLPFILFINSKNNIKNTLELPRYCLNKYIELEIVKQNKDKFFDRSSHQDPTPKLNQNVPMPTEKPRKPKYTFAPTSLLEKDLINSAGIPHSHSPNNVAPANILEWQGLRNNIGTTKE